MGFEAFEEEVLGGGLAAVCEEPGWGAVVFRPDEGVADEVEVVCGGECGEAVGAGEAERALGWLDGGGFHAVLRGDGVEVVGEEGGVGGVLVDPDIDADAEGEGGGGGGLERGELVGVGGGGGGDEGGECESEVHGRVVDSRADFRFYFGQCDAAVGSVAGRKLDPRPPCCRILHIA